MSLILLHKMLAPTSSVSSYQTSRFGSARQSWARSATTGLWGVGMGGKQDTKDDKQFGEWLYLRDSSNLSTLLNTELGWKWRWCSIDKNNLPQFFKGRSKDCCIIQLSQNSILNFQSKPVWILFVLPSLLKSEIPALNPPGIYPSNV